MTALDATTSRVARTTKLPGRFKDSPLMKHEKDAIKMGRYVIDARKERREEH